MFFEKCQQRPNCYIDLKDTLCYMQTKNGLYPVIPNSETNFIYNIQYFIYWRKPSEKEEQPSRNPNGGSSLSLSLSLYFLKICKDGPP